jgi:uncharacterized membrane protein
MQFRRLMPAALSLLAFALAVPLLDARSLWGDEAFSVWASKQPLANLLLGLDAQPPLYHVVLKLSRALWGESVFALRFSSVICGVLLTPIVYRMTRALAGNAPALLAMLATAVSPILIYYQQEARMYAIATLMTAGAMLFTARATAGCTLRRRDWLAFVLLSLGALYGHFYTVTLLAINAAALGIVALRRRSGRVHWLLAHAAIAIGFGIWFFGLQWMVLTRSGPQRRSLLPPLNEIADNIQRGISGLIFGLRFEAWQAPIALVLFALVLLGAVALWRARRRAAALLGAGWVALSCLFVFVTASRSGIVPDFNPRYLLFTLPALMLLAGGWLTSNARPWRAAIALVIVLATAGIGQLAFADMQWQKSRYDALLAAIQARAESGDAAALLNSDQFPLYDFYGPVNMPVWIMDNNLWSDAQQAEQLAQFARASGSARRVWFVKYGWAATPSLRSAAENSVAAAAVRLYNGEFGDATATLYERFDASGAPAPQEVDVNFGGQITLTGWRMRGSRFAPGDAISLDLIWRALAKPSADYTVFVHLRGAASGEQVNANDSAPLNGAAPTSSWQPGQIVTDTRGIEVPSNAPAGRYQVIIGLYRYPSFERLAIDSGGSTEYVVREVEVGP